MSLLGIIAGVAGFVSFVIPITFISIRESVKRQRREVVRDLQAVFEVPDPSKVPASTNATDIIPSFEFVKYKYFFHRNASSTSVSAPVDYSRFHWFISSVPLFVTVGLLNFYILVVIAHYAFGFAFLELKGQLAPSQSLPLMSLVVLAAYSGALLFMLKAFFRAINNFDFSPLSLIGAWVNLSLGVASALVFVLGVMLLSEKFGNSDPSSPASEALIIVTAFAIGRMPDLTSRNILRAAALRNYKREDIAVYKSFTAIPVEVIDGIDTEIRDRLADYHINAVQNLAAANPLMLFVETPYGVYQIMDWVAQAQLCCSVGPSTLLLLWKLGIRTIFDLERIALDPSCIDPDLLSAVGRILLPSPTGAGAPVKQATVIADIRMRLENPHVHRLRQLFLRVGDRIGDKARRLPPVLNCPIATDPRCPFTP